MRTRVSLRGRAASGSARTRSMMTGPDGAFSRWRDRLRHHQGARALLRRDRHPHLRAVDGRGDRRGRVGPGHQRAHRRPSSLPGPRRPAHHRGAPRPARGRRARLRRRRQQHGPHATFSAARSRAWTSAIATPAGLRARSSRSSSRRSAIAETTGATIARRRRPRRRGRRRRRRRHRHLGVDGPGGRARRARLGVFEPFQVDAVADGAAPPTARSSCTACPRTAARRSPTRSSTRPHSVVFDEAENRLHAQKALLSLVARLDATRSDRRDRHEMRKRQRATGRDPPHRARRAGQDAARARRPAQGAGLRLHAGDGLARHHRDGPAQAARGRLRARRGPAPAAHGLRPRPRRGALGQPRARQGVSRARRPALPRRSTPPSSTASSARRR